MVPVAARLAREIETRRRTHGPSRYAGAKEVLHGRQDPQSTAETQKAEAAKARELARCDRRHAAIERLIPVGGDH